MCLPFFIALTSFSFWLPFVEWFAFIGKQAAVDAMGSPYAIDFRSNISDSSAMKPMNVTVHSCGDPSLGCSCGDCPSSSVCLESSSPAPQNKGSCRITMGSLEVRWVWFVFPLGCYNNHVHIALHNQLFLVWSWTVPEVNNKFKFPKEWILLGIVLHSFHSLTIS